MLRAFFISLLMFATVSSAAPPATPIPSKFASTGDDRRAIEALLSDYTKAVSTKDQALFETLLLSKDLSFAAATSAIKASGAAGGSQQYERFRKGVFEGPPFQQRFQNVHIEQDGPLAQVSLVFINSTPKGSTWGWKTMQLLKVEGRWKIASEFFTGHD